jgi:hypothetical protein
MLRHTFQRTHAALTAAATVRPGRLTGRPRLTRGDDRGQATAEYGLVILAAGGIALGVIAWASGTGSFTGMFESVVRKLTEAL